jgi:hypothetical protein
MFYTIPSQKPWEACLTWKMMREQPSELERRSRWTEAERQCLVTYEDCMDRQETERLKEYGVFPEETTPVMFQARAEDRLW